MRSNLSRSILLRNSRFIIGLNLEKNLKKSFYALDQPENLHIRACGVRGTIYRYPNGEIRTVAIPNLDTGYRNV